MAKFALVRGGAVVGFRELESADDLAHKVDKKGDGGPFVRPVADPGKPEINKLIETLEISQSITPNAVEIVYTVKPRPLEEVKTDLMARVDREAERERLKHITPGDGQALEYAYVAQEARIFLENPAAAPEGFPLLSASVSSGEAATLLEAANLVVKKSAEWIAIGAKVREIRISAKKSIASSTDAKSAFSAYSGTGWS